MKEDTIDENSCVEFYDVISDDGEIQAIHVMLKTLSIHVGRNHSGYISKEEMAFSRNAMIRCAQYVVDRLRQLEN